MNVTDFRRSGDLAEIVTVKLLEYEMMTVKVEIPREAYDAMVRVSRETGEDINTRIAHMAQRAASRSRRARRG